ncbi:MAG: sulfotransferase [Microcoleus sp.]
MRSHFISGLPRSGSTLLAALLRQNPRFHSAMTSPIGGASRSNVVSHERRQSVFR